MAQESQRAQVILDLGLSVHCLGIIIKFLLCYQSQSLCSSSERNASAEEFKCSSQYWVDVPKLRINLTISTMNPNHQSHVSLNPNNQGASIRPPSKRKVKEDIKRRSNKGSPAVLQQRRIKIIHSKHTQWRYGLAQDQRKILINSSHKLKDRSSFVRGNGRWCTIENEQTYKI